MNKSIFTEQQITFMCIQEDTVISSEQVTTKTWYFLINILQPVEEVWWTCNDRKILLKVTRR
jgi:hypothetical protein